MFVCGLLRLRSADTVAAASILFLHYMYFFLKFARKNVSAPYNTYYRAESPCEIKTPRSNEIFRKNGDGKNKTVCDVPWS